MRMDDQPYVVLLQQQPAQPVGGPAEPGPLLGGQLGRLGERARLLVPVHGRNEDQMMRPRGSGQRGDPPGMRERLVPCLGPVQRAERGAAGDLQPPGVQLGLQPPRVGGQIAVRAELQPLVAGLDQLVEETGVRHLVLVLGEPHPPGVGGGAEAQVADGGTERDWRRCHGQCPWGRGGGCLSDVTRATSAL